MVADGTPVAKAGTDLPISWKPGEGSAEVRIVLYIDQHGNSPIKLVCISHDQGAFTLPASLLSGLVESGVSGFPTLGITRRSVDSIGLAGLDPGWVEFEISSRVTRAPMVDGHQPCTSDADCPDDRVCDLETETCRDPKCAPLEPGTRAVPVVDP